MTKWKEFADITGLSIISTIGEAAWTGFLVSTTKKIPHIGIPVAAILGITGMLGTLWFANAWRFAYQDWYKEYYDK